MFPVEFTGLITEQDFNYLMGLAGIVCGFVVWAVWSQSL